MLKVIKFFNLQEILRKKKTYITGTDLDFFKLHAYTLLDAGHFILLSFPLVPQLLNHLQR